MASYDNAEVTKRERLAKQNQRSLAEFNADTTRNQLSQQLANYDMSQGQDRRLADVQLKQNSRKTAADRFEANRDLQNAAIGLYGSMGQAMNGSTLGNTMYMLNNRNDKDNMNYWTQHQVNQNAVENAYDEAVNQNNVARNDAAINAEANLRAMEGDLAANLNNINPSLYEAPGKGSADLQATGTYDKNKVAANNARLSGYLMPDNSAQAARDIAPRNRVGGRNYFSSLVNRFNGR